MLYSILCVTRSKSRNNKTTKMAKLKKLNKKKKDKENILQLFFLEFNG